MVIKTLVLKLHKPTAEKKRVLDRAIERYNDAIGYLFEHTKDNIPEIESEMHSGGSFLSRRITSLLSKDLMDALNVFGVQPFKDSLKLDYAMTMIAYLALRRTQHAGYPQVVRDGKKFDDAFYALVERYGNGGLSRRLLGLQLKKLYEGLRMKKPVLFGRYAKNRDYCLLYDEQSGRYYAKLYLMSVKDEDRRGGLKRGGNRLAYISKDGGYLAEDNKRERYLVVPLSFGKKQKEVLEQGRKDPTMFKTARLKEKNGEYYLLVSVAVNTTERIPGRTTLGIVRGISCAARYTVTDGEGAVLLERELMMPQPPEKNDFHIAAKSIVGIARQYESRIVSYHLGSLGDQLSRDNCLAALTAGQFNKLNAMITYKAELAGLKKPVAVSPRGLFYTCPRCGVHTMKNRFMHDKFMCIRCGYTGEIERVGALNAAQRLRKYGGSLLPFKASIKHGRITFTNEMLDIRYETDYTREAVDGFYEYIAQLVEKWKLAESVPLRAGAKKISYYKKFIGITNPREEIAIVDM
ncbi:hypothetical protein CE91St36_19040 [Christensenellaceae bacterium]|nr:hypothetical protein CE91St36_19040 [Christensenellaceae bacterium]BDF61754.1 hypothetical protein CE91St37_19040 [Christensenellaceae bacterium]